jgi:hypothetical protein
MAVTMKNAVFWDVAPCRSCVSRRSQPPAHAGSSPADFSALKVEAICSSETWVHTRSTRCHISLTLIWGGDLICRTYPHVHTLHIKFHCITEVRNSTITSIFMISASAPSLIKYYMQF